MRSVFLLSFFVSCLFAVHSSRAQTVLPLYPGEIPGSKPHKDNEKVEQRGGITIVSRISRPTLTIFYPEKSASNGAAILICPGGGYWVNASTHEGTDVARKFTEMGVTAFVLKYRIPNDSTMANRETGPLQDVQQAIRVIRAGAEQFAIDTARIGIMGFSAGGHLASTAGTHFDRPVLPGPVSVRPNFMILVYPVISFRDSVAHMGSREQIIGKNPDPAKIRLYSNELQVTPKTPPTFLVHASDDKAVKPENSIAFYRALISNGVKAELHIYQAGGHGFGMNNPTSNDQWMDRCRNWLVANKIVPK